MKLIALLLSLCLTFNVLAASGTIQELEREMDEYQYSLTVDWDQKEEKVYQEHTEAFFKKLEVLIKEQGLTKESILALAEKKSSNKDMLNALQLKLSLMGGAKSAEEMAAILKDASAELYKKGASWNGNTQLVLIGLVFVAIIGYSVWFDANHTCVEYGTRYECNYYGSIEYGGATSCGYNTYCVNYERK